MLEDKPNLLLFVCTANVCRSPMAEVLMRHALAAEEEPLRSLQTASAGVVAAPGHPATGNSQTALKKVGLSLTKHKSQPVTPELLSRCLAVFAMTESHLDILQAHFDQLPERLFLFREFIPDNPQKEIPDPYGADLRHYEACRDSMVEAIPPLLKYLRKELA